MADTKITALTAAAAIDSDDVMYIVEDGVDKKVSMAQLDAYIGPFRSSSISDQALTAATDSVITGSRLVFPQSRMQAGVVYRARIVMTKSAAGTATPIFNVRVGTAGTTADTSRLTYTGVAQTAAADTGYLEVQATIRSHSASVGQMASWLRFDHDLASTGFANATRGFQGQSVSGLFDTTVANTGIHISINSGASAAWIIRQCYSELVNLAN